MKKYVSIFAMACFVIMLSLSGRMDEVRAGTVEFELEPDTTEQTNQNITIDVITDMNQISEAKWASGNQKISYFTKHGNEVLVNKKYGYFEVSKNNIYTVYVKDKKGNQEIETIEISNIDKTKPVIDYILDASDRTKGMITLKVTDNVKLKSVVYYYGKLNDTEDDRWENAIDVEGDTFEVYKNATISVKATDTAGNAKIKQIAIKYINRTNNNVTYGFKERIQIKSFYGDMLLNISSMEPITLKGSQAAYLITYYFKNVSYGGKDTCYTTNRNFKVFDAKGNELKTTNIAIDLKDTYATILPKVIDYGKDASCSFLVYGDTAPAYLQYYYWDEDLRRSYIEILCTDDYQQMSTKQIIPSSEDREIKNVNDYETVDGTYSGWMVNGKLQGVGEYTYKNGKVYTGEFINGTRDGYGKLTYPGGSWYSGEFSNDKRNGFGVYDSDLGVVYTGIWEDDNFIWGKIVDNKGNTHWVNAK